MRHSPRVTGAASANTPPTATPAIVATELLVGELGPAWLIDGEMVDGEEIPGYNDSRMLSEEEEVELRQEASFEASAV